MSCACIRSRGLFENSTAWIACWWNRTLQQSRTAEANTRDAALQLHPENTFAIERVCEPSRIQCTAGILWITQSGSCRDVMLTQGESHFLGRGGKVVIQALAGPAQFQLSKQLNEL